MPTSYCFKISHQFQQDTGSNDSIRSKKTASLASHRFRQIRKLCIWNQFDWWQCMSTSVQQKNSWRKHLWSDFLPSRPDSEMFFLSLAEIVCVWKNYRVQTTSSHSYSYKLIFCFLRCDWSKMIEAATLASYQTFSKSTWWSFIAAPTCGLSLGEFYFLLAFSPLVQASVR